MIVEHTDFTGFNFNCNRFLFLETSLLSQKHTLVIITGNFKRAMHPRDKKRTGLSRVYSFLSLIPYITN